MTKILIVEDEPGIASFLDKGLRAEGFDTEILEDGDAAVGAARDGEVDLMILDLGLPGKEGLEVLAEVRDRGDKLPVIILTATDDARTTVAGLDSGADDYMTKPFRFEELMARVRARLRGASELTIHQGDITLDLRTRTATVAGRKVELTAREYSLLDVFLRHPGEILSRDDLMEQVWGEDGDPTSNVVDVYVLYLRRKLGEGLIKTVRGKGYRLEPEPAPEPAEPGADEAGSAVVAGGARSTVAAPEQTGSPA